MLQLTQENRFACFAGCSCPGIDASYIIIDHLQQRWFSVRIPLLGVDDDCEMEDEAMRVLASCVDSLEENIQTIEVEEDGGLTFTTEEAASKFSFPVFDGDPKIAIFNSKLAVVDRIQTTVDLVCPKGQESRAEPKQLFVLKRALIPQRIQRCIDEISILQGVAGHRNFVQFHKVVLDPRTLTMVGFTTHYVAGQSLRDYSLSFRFSWLDDITKAIEHLNFVLGVVHNGLAAHNILVDSETGLLKIIDFDRSKARSTIG